MSLHAAWQIITWPVLPMGRDMSSLKADPFTRFIASHSI
jgi:hypothetical protein